MAKFKKLDVPHQWKDEFTKYPHGYTIFEALCKWTKQVDNMVDNVNDWNAYLDGFVENFDYELQAEVKETITNWQNEGLLDGIIESALNTELDNVKSQLTQTTNEINTKLDIVKAQLMQTTNEINTELGSVKTQLTQTTNEINNKINRNEVVNSLSTKVDKGGNEQISWAMLKQDVKENITGGNTAVVGTNSVNTSTIVDKAVASSKRTSIGDFGILACLSGGIINFDFINNVVVIPAVTNIAYRKTYYTSSQLTKGEALHIPMYDNASEMVLMFNTSTMTFEVKNTITIRSASEDEITIALFSRQFKKVFIIGEYLINGEKPNTIESVEVLPSYVLNEIKDTHNKVTLKSGNNRLVFAHLTDMHGQVNHLKALAKYCRVGQPDFVIFGGDSIATSETDIDTIRTQFDVFAEVLYDIKQPIFSVKGNHDWDNADVFSMTEWSNRLIKPYAYKNNIVVDATNPDGGYYYRDFEKQKVRVIVLNTTEGGSRWAITLTQIDWLVNKALMVDEDWSFLVVGHHPTRQRYTAHPPLYNGNILEGVLKACNEGTVYNDGTIVADFTGKKRDIIAYVFGHTHYDVIEIPSDLGFPMISTLSSYQSYYENPPEGNYSYPRTADTVTEDAWDVFVVDTESKQINIIRYGAGVDRSINY